METVYKKVYVLLHTNPDGSTTDMGEANDQDSLQKLYDALNDTLVLKIIDSLKTNNSALFVPKTRLRVRCCNKSGVYVQNAANEPVLNLVNTHDDFFRYFEKYKRSLYGDRGINKEMADTLLRSFKEEPVLHDQIRLDESNWFKEQVATSRANNLPIIVRSYPKFPSHERLEALQKGRELALQVLSGASQKS